MQNNSNDAYYLESNPLDGEDNTLIGEIHSERFIATK